MSVVDNDYQTNLLFKQFVGVAAARLDDQFSVEQFSSVPNIFSTTVMLEDIPSKAPIKISGPNGLDASDNWLDSSCNYGNNFVAESIFFDPSGSVDNGKTFAEIYPDSNLKFYKRVSLVPCEQNSQGRVWGSFTDYSGVIMYKNKESVLQNTIPFKYDDISASYLPVVRYNKIQTGKGAGSIPYVPNFQIGNINANPLYWVMDAGTGFLQFYNTQSNLESVGVKDIKTNGIQEKEWAPVISCYVYNGKLGIKNLDISSNGGNSGDISGGLNLNCSDISAVENIYFCNDTAILGDTSNVLTITGEISVKDTNLIQEVTLNPFILPPIPILPPATFASLVIASVVKTDAITTGYFTMQLTIPNYEQIIHFIAGVIDNKSPFIKVISNTNSDFLNGCSNLYIVDDGNDYFLCTDFLYAGGTQVDYIKIVLSNNSQNYSAPLSNNINWILQDLLQLPIGPTYTSHVEVSLNLIGGGPYAITSLYEIIDNSFQVNRDLILLGNENITGDIISTDPSAILDISAILVDISGALEVNNFVEIKGNESNNLGYSLDVCGNTLLSGKVIVDLSGGNNDGITIINRGSGGPQLKFQDNNTTYPLGTTTYKNIYVDGTTDNLNIDIGSDNLLINSTTSNLNLENTGSTSSNLKLISNGASYLSMGPEHSGRKIILIASSNKTSLETTNNNTNGGFSFECTQTTNPQHNWYILNQLNSLAIRIAGNTSGTNFVDGSVQINPLENDIDFTVGTTDTSHAFFVDAGLNTININSPIYINENLSISGDLSISGNIYSNSNIELSGNLLVYGNGTIDQDLSVNAVTTLTDLSFSDYLNNVATLPSETTIPYRKHQTVASSPYRDLKVDGYSEYSITTENLSTTNTQEDWVTIARVGFQDMTNQSQRADGLFEITCNNSGTHQTIRLEASHHYKKGQTLDVVKNVTYGLSTNRHIKAARMSYGSTYDGGILQIQISQNTSDLAYTQSKITIKLYYNNNYFGWTSDLSGLSAPLPDNTPSGYSQAGYPGTGNILWDGSTYSNFTLFYPSIEGIDLTDRISAAGNPGQSVLNYTSDMILNKVYMKDDLDLSGNGITNIGSITTNELIVESTTGDDLLTLNGNTRISQFNFNSGTANPGYIIMKDISTNNSSYLRQSGSTAIWEGTDLQVGFGGGVWGDIKGGEVTGWFNTRDYYATANASNPSVGTSAEGVLGYTSITNVCPGGVKIIPTSGTTIYIEPPATGVYTITVTGIWSGDAWGSGDQRQPLLTLRGPPYFGSTNPEVIAQQGATRFVDQAGSYVNYMTFNWTGRMVQSYGGSQAQYLIHAKNNGSSSRAYNGKIQVTRIC